MALSCVAMGDTTLTLDDAIFTSEYNNSITLPNDNNAGTYDATFTIAMTMDRDALYALLGEGQTPQWGHFFVKAKFGNNRTSSTGVVLNGSSSNNKLTVSNLYANWGNDNAWNPNGGSDVRWDGGQDLSDLEWDKITHVGFAYTHKAQQQSYSAWTMVFLDKEGNDIFSSYVAAPGLGSASINNNGIIEFSDSVVGSYYFDGIYEENDIKALTKLAATAAPLPEPTTATLSLLALAGLAARRRRK